MKKNSVSSQQKAEHLDKKVQIKNKKEQKAVPKAIPRRQFHYCLKPQCLGQQCTSWDQKFQQITFQQAFCLTVSQIQSRTDHFLQQILTNITLMTKTYERGIECLLKKVEEKGVQYQSNTRKLSLDKSIQLQRIMELKEKQRAKFYQIKQKLNNKIFTEIDTMKQKQFKIDQEEFLVQEYLTEEEWAEYEDKNPILKTIIGNICLDYEGSFTKLNIINILSIFSKVYQEQKINYWQRQSIYEQAKKELKKYCLNSGKAYLNEMALLEWLQNKRGIKFDGQTLPNAKNQLANTNYEIPNTSRYQHNLIKAQQIEKNKIITSFINPIELIFQSYQNNKLLFYLKLVQKQTQKQVELQEICRNIGYLINKKKNIQNEESNEELKNELNLLQSYFFDINVNYIMKLIKIRKKKNNQQPKFDTGWVVDFHPEMPRFFWKANKPIDKYDVDNLLHFILAKNSLYSECPSIVINAGSHGDQKGKDAFQNKNKLQVDPSILYGMQFIIANLLQEIEKGEFDSYLTKENIHQKIFINEVQHHRGGVYPETANHIIDTYCNGAYSIIKKDLITDDFQLGDQILFLSQKKNLIIPDLFWLSNVLTTREEEKSLINLFDDGDKIDSVSLLYRQSIFGFSGPDQFHKFFYETDTIVICRTFQNKVIGAYTPIAHRSRKPSVKESQTKPKRMYLKDESGKSFIFTLSQDEKLRKLKLVNKQKAVYHQNNTFREICFGDEEFGTNTISESSNIYCRVNKSAYFNENYQSFSEEERLVKFCGEPYEQFSCKEWEVWKINFRKSEEKSMITQSNSLNPHKKVLNSKIISSWQ